MRRTQISKFLSFVLRHKPEKIGLRLQCEGWADVSELLSGCRRHGIDLDEGQLREIVERDDKGRFVFSPDGTRIRATHGHSVDVDLGLEPAVPPARLYHGTAARNLASIRTHGLQSWNRQFAHLSTDVETAIQVGGRHGRPVVLVIDAGGMLDAGHQFFVSNSGVWLTEKVPPSFIGYPEEGAAEE